MLRVCNGISTSALYFWLAFAPTTALAADLTLDQAKAITSAFYDVFNEPSRKDVRALVEKVAAPDWQSCSSEGACIARGQAIDDYIGFGKAVPNLKWEVRDIVVSGDKIIVRGQGSGTPAGDFFGVPHGGKSFNIMSIDIHTIKDGRMSHTYHLEDWAQGIRQLSAK